MRRFFDSRWFELATTPLRILLILLVALVLRAVAHRFIDRVVRVPADGVLRLKERAAFLEGSPLLSERRRQRAETVASVLRSTASVLVLGIAFAMVLSELGLDLAPVIASAGIVGVALGFGAQNVVRDVLNGMFLILEDQYGVGDVVDLGPATGTVEAVALRTTRLRSADGTVWHVRNGEVLRVGNSSQGWARAVVDLPVPRDADVAAERARLKDAADAVWRDLPDAVLEEPEVVGVEQLTTDELVLRVVARTAPLEQDRVARALRERIASARRDG